MGGLDPLKAQSFTNQDYYDQLQQSITSGTPLSFSTLRKIQELVYSGTFKDNAGDVVEYTFNRPDKEKLPMTFTATNLVNMKPGYYRIQAFSEDALKYDGEDLAGDGSNIKGIIGPRYISGYRFESEKTDPEDSKNNGGRWLHFLETDMEHSTIHTYGQLLSKISAVDAKKEGGTSDRDQIAHKAMRGNIEILPADFDPSSIFQFVDASGADSYIRYNIKTQGLQLWARPGTSEISAETGTHEFGRTELVESTPSTAEGYTNAESPGKWDNKFRLEDIGGAATTIRVRHTTAENWDDMVSENLKTNYVCIDRNHRYRITCHTDNEMVEIGDHYTTDGLNGIQDTKWLLQPVGIREEWPYNQMPLRVEVQKGGVKNQQLTGAALTATENEDPYYYGSLYVPFDTRLSNTTDAAFTFTGKTDESTRQVTMSSVSQMNNMGNPQYVPSEWPVVIRTSSPLTSSIDEDGNTITTCNDGTPIKTHVNLYLPNNEPTTSGLTENFAKIKLKGSYLERSLTTADIPDIATDGVSPSKAVMVFGHAQAYRQ